MSPIEWSAPRILTELCDAELRKNILASFWTGADEPTRRAATMQLAKALHFREETLRKATAGKKAEWLASRIHQRDFHEHFEMALMVYHTINAKEMLAAFLDFWKIPHENGTIGSDEYTIPGEAEIEGAVEALREQFPLRNMTVYLATAGLLMGDGWRKSAWPVVDKLAAAGAKK